jgi:hypothetical protein
MKRTILSAEDADFLTRTIARNKERFGGFLMGPEDDDKSDDGDGEDDDDKSDEDSDDEGDKSKSDGDPNTVDYWKKRAQQHERQARKDFRRAEKAEAALKGKAAGKPDDKAKADDGEKVDADKIREEAKAEAARDALHGRVEDKIEAKARAFADPEDAVAVLLRSHDINDFIDGDKVDVEEIAEALKELGEKKPHLLAQGGKKFQGDADGGTRKESKGRPKNLGDAVARHYDQK